MGKTNPLAASDSIRLRPPVEEATSLIELLRSVRQPEHPWDAVAFTDGSGMTMETPCGFASVTLFRRSSRPLWLTGSVSNGTSQIAEVRAVYELLQYLMQAKVGNRQGGFNLYLITDSKYVADTLSRINKDPIRAINTKSHTMLWLGIQHAARIGIRTIPTHVARNKNPLMTFADEASRVGRQLFDAKPFTELLEDAIRQCEVSFPLTSGSQSSRRKR